MAEPLLVQFRFSHFNEKARWALDYKAIPHRRRTLLPGLHARQARKLTGQSAVPILCIGGRAIPDSTHIIAALEHLFPEPPLYPRDEAAYRRGLELEEFFDEELGPPLRLAVFSLSRRHAAFCASLFSADHGAAVRQLYRPMIGASLRLNRNLDSRAFERSRRQVEAAFERLEKEIQPSGYLVGESFGVADLTAAALLSPLVLPPESPHPPLLPLPEPVRAFRAAFESRRGFQWAAEIYRRHRGESAEIRP